MPHALIAVTGACGFLEESALANDCPDARLYEKPWRQSATDSSAGWYGLRLLRAFLKPVICTNEGSDSGDCRKDRS